jgi:broad specificity phosphatase PhoE
MSLAFVRHGRTAGNSAATGGPGDIHRGWLDWPLTDEGVQDALRAGAALAQWRQRLSAEGETVSPPIMSSDLEHAKETAGIIATVLGMPTQSTPSLRTWNLGAFAGRSTVQSSRQIKQLITHPNVAAPTGESINAFLHRYVPFVKPLVEAADWHIVVAHGRNSQVLIGLAAKQGEDVDLASLEQAYPVDPGGLLLVSANWIVSAVNLQPQTPDPMLGDPIHARVDPGAGEGQYERPMASKRAFQVQTSAGDWQDVSAVSDEHARQKMAARTGAAIHTIGPARLKPGIAPAAPSVRDVPGQ